MSQCRMQGVCSCGSSSSSARSGARLQLQRVGHAHQVGQRHALQRQRKALAQGRQVGVQAVRAGHHRQAGQAAFGGLGLQDQRHRVPRRPSCRWLAKPVTGGPAGRAGARTAIPPGAGAPAARRPAAACRRPAAAVGRFVQRHGDAEHRLAARGRGRQRQRGQFAGRQRRARHLQHMARLVAVLLVRQRPRSAAAPAAPGARSPRRWTARTARPAAWRPAAPAWPAPRPATRSGRARPARRSRCRPAAHARPGAARRLARRPRVPVAPGRARCAPALPLAVSGRCAVRLRSSALTLQRARWRTSAWAAARSASTSSALACTCASEMNCCDCSDSSRASACSASTSRCCCMPCFDVQLRQFGIQRLQRGGPARPAACAPASCWRARDSARLRRRSSRLRRTCACGRRPAGALQRQHKQHVAGLHGLAFGHAALEHRAGGGRHQADQAACRAPARRSPWPCVCTAPGSGRLPSASATSTTPAVTQRSDRGRTSCTPPSHCWLCACTASGRNSGRFSITTQARAGHARPTCGVQHSPASTTRRLLAAWRVSPGRRAAAAWAPGSVAAQPPRGAGHPTPGQFTCIQQPWAATGPAPWWRLAERGSWKCAA
jgi:hypothetical protein